MNHHRKKIPKNANGGRDFVIGDLHGCYDRLVQFMEFANFDKSKDRIFSVADLIDRGAQNLECLALIYEPWFFCVRGNHEGLMADYFNDEPLGLWWAGNGGNWGTHYMNELSDEAMFVKDAAKKLDEFPVMLTVEKQDGTFFHVIHAELAADGPISDEDLDNAELFDYVAFYPAADGPSIIWGRYIFMMLYGRTLSEDTCRRFTKGAIEQGKHLMFNDKLSHIYSGHTIVQDPVRFFGQTNLDTGAYKSVGDYKVEWAGLTVTEPLTDRFWKVNDDGCIEIKPVILG